MKKILVFIPIVALIVFTSCKKEAKDIVDPITEAEKAVKVKLVLTPKSGSNVKGNVVFRQESDTVEMTAVLEGLKPGTHTMQVNKKSDCSLVNNTEDLTKFNNSNIENFTADNNGFAVVNFSTKEWCIGCGDTNKDITGKTIIVHEIVDASQASDANNSSISCCGIIK